MRNCSQQKMEVPVVAEKPSVCEETENAKQGDSVENFEKFVFELFDKNGVLNDLRAYLRGHIVNVLKSAHTGDPPASQRHFTQRLELKYQALNMLIAEYLLRLEFSYSLSVFVSEIPLANMVFDFAKTLMQSSNGDFTTLRFPDSDVWSILNYLGVKCDSEHASNIVEMYRSVESCPLLLCIFKCIPMYNKIPAGIEGNSSNESVSSSVKSLDTLGDKTKSFHRNVPIHDKCRHYALCRTCQSKIMRVKEKYRNKKKCLSKTVKETKIDSHNVECLMKNIGVLERSLIDEMFQQLKSVYEAEVEMVKEEEQRKVKRSLATHALQLQKRWNEIEESLKAREEELEQVAAQKKEFLWGLARALRDQQRHVARAVQDVQHETDRLAAKEDSLKKQLGEAEQILRQRGEEVRTQIASELSILERHLESMKAERENINRERTELNNLKKHETSEKVHNTEHEELKSHYDLLKNELSILRKYLESISIQRKCVIERSTITELYDVSSKINVTLNNGQGVEYAKHDKLRSTQVVNDFKKQKNVNFNQSNLDEIYRESSQERRSSSSDVGDGRLDRFQEQEVLRQLREENQRLKTFAAQQSEHISELRCQHAQVRAQLTAAQFRPTAAAPPAGPTSPMGPTVAAACRPRTAPAVVPPYTYLVHRMSTSSSAHALNLGWRKGAGEELSLFSNAQPRILVPGDTIPFIGVLRDRHNDNRRHIVNQWRNLRRRTSPLGGVVKPKIISPTQRDRLTMERPDPSTSQMESSPQNRNVSPETQHFENTLEPTCGNRHQRPKTAVIADKMREKSPNTVLREVKNKLRTKDSTKRHLPTARDKSPNVVLREAKLRLRKLEIEAEAVEKSYLNFRKRQAELRSERTSYSAPPDVLESRDRSLEIKRSSSLQKLDDAHQKHLKSHLESKSTKSYYDTYLNEFRTKYNIGETYFSNKNLALNKTHPIPESYSEVEDKRPPNNYLETPITEFRKLYYSDKSRFNDRYRDKIDENKTSDSVNKIDSEKILDGNIEKVEGQSASEIHKEDSKLENPITELEILKQNINKIHDMSDETDDFKIEDEKTVLREEPSKTEATEVKNLLRVEVESVSRVNDIKITESQTQDLLLVVQSPIDVRDALESDSDAEKLSPQMTIIVSPKRSSPEGPNDMESLGSRSLSPDQVARKTRNDVIDAIFRADPDNQLSSVQMQLEMSKEVLEDSITESEKGLGGEDYPDDFSADVDNYNSRSDYENNSPISIPKTSEDENFWDS